MSSTAKPAKLTTAQIVKLALDWGIPSMDEMISGTDKNDPHRAVLEGQIAQMRAYRNKHYGKPRDPFANAKLVNIFDLPETKTKEDLES